MWDERHFHLILRVGLSGKIIRHQTFPSVLMTDANVLSLGLVGLILLLFVFIALHGIIIVPFNEETSSFRHCRSIAVAKQRGTQCDRKRSYKYKTRPLTWWTRLDPLSPLSSRLGIIMLKWNWRMSRPRTRTLVNFKPHCEVTMYANFILM